MSMQDYKLSQCPDKDTCVSRSTDDASSSTPSLVSSPPILRVRQPRGAKMPQDQQPMTPGVSSRRSACDRCRGQKLRCLRESDDADGPCDRCTKADAQCVTSPIYHMRNKFAEDNAAFAVPSSRKRRRQQDQTIAPKHAVIPSMTPWQAMDPFARSTRDRSVGSGVASLTYSNWNSVIDGSVSASTAVSTEIHAWDSPGIALENLFPDNNVASIVDGRAASSTDQQPQPDGQAHSTPPMPYHPDIPGISPDFMDLVMPGNEADSKNYTVMNELSNINASLAAQMRQMVQGRPFVTLKTLIAPECGKAGESATTTTTPLENILNTTKLYLDVLTRMGGPTQSSPSAGSSAPNLTDGYSGYTSTAASTLLSHDDSDQSSNCSPGMRPPSAAGCSGPTQTDPATQLLVLVCYIYVLRLHVALFAHIREYLQIISESNEPTIDPLPGLSGLSDLPLQSGNLQATLIIQYVTNMLERIETLLGLPREFRIGTREDGRDGLLRHDGFLEIAKGIIRKEDTGLPDEGKGGIRSLRRDMKKAKRLLRACIAP